MFHMCCLSVCVWCTQKEHFNHFCLTLNLTLWSWIRVKVKGRAMGNQSHFSEGGTSKVFPNNLGGLMRSWSLFSCTSVKVTVMRLKLSRNWFSTCSHPFSSIYFLFLIRVHPHERLGRAFWVQLKLRQSPPPHTHTHPPFSTCCPTNTPRLCCLSPAATRLVHVDIWHKDKGLSLRPWRSRLLPV